MVHRNIVVKLKTAKSRKPSSAIWLRRQLNDQYVSRAQKDGYRSRAAYKLLGIEEKFKILKRGSVVLDLGAAPGSWLQVVAEKKAKKVVAVDLLPIEPIKDVEFIQGDFTDEPVLAQINQVLSGEKVNVLLSDMAPNTSGNKSLDHLRIMVLCEAVFNFAKENLANDGVMVIKIFQGGAEDHLLQQIKQLFKRVKHFKPEASRKESGEMYLVATGFSKPGHSGL